MTSTAKKLVEKTLIVVFGASGDVAKKMTYPALYALYNDKQLPPDTRIIGYARSDLKADKFNDQISGGLGDKADKGKVEEFKKINQYVKGAYDEDSAFQNLEKELQKIADDKFGGESNRIYYLALPPSQFTNLSEKIKKNNYKGKVNRLVIEKPFGKDTSSCEDMMEKIMADWKEEEIYRIDHFLGEEMVRTLPHLRFGNEQLIEPLLNKEKVSAVKVELLEKIGCEGRGGYFDEFGMIRDVLQNHLLQVALMVALEKPESLEGDALRDEKRKVLQAMRPVEMKDAVFGQYIKGAGKPGYVEDESVEDKQSRTETFSNTVIWIDNEKWKGVPFILCGGKALDTDLCRVTIQLKTPKNPLYSQSKPTELRIELFPEPKVYFMMQTKTPVWRTSRKGPRSCWITRLLGRMNVFQERTRRS